MFDQKIRDAITKMIEAHGHSGDAYDRERPPVAVFDLDNTCIDNDISERAVALLEAETGREILARYDKIYREQGRREAYRECAREIGAGCDDAVISALSDRVLERGLLRPRPEILSLIEDMHRAGWHVWFVSASLEPLVKAAARWFDVPAERALGIRLAFDPEEHLYTSECLDPVTYREGKVEAIDRFIGRRPVFAAGDSDSDIEMMRASKHALVIDRGEVALKQEARKNKWWFQEGWSCEVALA